MISMAVRPFAAQSDFWPSLAIPDTSALSQDSQNYKSESVGDPSSRVDSKLVIFNWSPSLSHTAKEEWHEQLT